MTDDELKAIRERCEAASRWWWSGAEELVGDDGTGWIAAGPQNATWEQANKDATFIRHARTDVPALLDEIARLEQVSGIYCESCGWAMKFPDEPCRCELVKEVERLEQCWQEASDARSTEMACRMIAEHALERVRNERDEARAEVESLRENAAELVHDREAAEAEVARVRGELAAMRNERDQYIARAMRAETERAQAQRELSSVRSRPLAIKQRDEARAEVERLTREVQVERCGVRPVDEQLQRVTTDRDELHVAWKREREEVTRLTRERDEARDKILEYIDSIVERDAEIAHLTREQMRERAQWAHCGHEHCEARLVELYDAAKVAEERLTRERDDAFASGSEAMRETAVAWSKLPENDWEALAYELENLPSPVFVRHPVHEQCETVANELRAEVERLTRANAVINDMLDGKRPDTWREDIESMQSQRDEALDQVERLTRERDSYARSHQILKGVHGALTDGGCVVPPLDSFEVEETIRSVCDERDEARAIANAAVRELNEASARACIADQLSGETGGFEP